MALKFRRGTTAQKSGSLAFGEPYVNTTLGTLQIGLETGDVTLTALGTGSNLEVAGISGSSLDITGNAKIDGDLTLGGKITIGDASSDTVNVIASLSSSLIPSITNTFDLGSTDKVWRELYISTGSINFVDGTTVVSTLSSTTLTQILDNTGSVEDRMIEIGIVTGSLIQTASAHEQRLDTFESISSSFARTNQSNNFGNNQIISGNLDVDGKITAVFAVSASTIYVGKSDGNSKIDLVNSTNGRGFELISFDGNSFSIRNPLTGLSSFRIDSGSQYHTHLFGDLYIASGSVYSANGVSGPIYATNGVVSGSSQITISDTTGYDTFSSSISTQAASLVQSYSASAYNKFAKLDESNIFNGTQTITGSMYVSGDLIVQGSSSLQNISASAVDIGTNIILLNTDTPAVRFAGISVFDSGSTAGTGSLFWDSENERWIYQKSSGSSYSGGMLISGPRNTGTLGSEVGMPTNKLIMGIGGDHISSSAIYHDSTTTAFPQNVEITGSLKAALTGNASTATALQTARLINGTSFDGTTDITIIDLVSGSSQINLTQTTNYASGILARLNAVGVVSGSSQIQLGSTSGNIALSTQTTGDYVASLTQGTGVTITNNSGEGSTPTIAIGQSVATSASPTFAGLTINGAITATGDITAYYSSDKRYKNNIQPITDALAKVRTLNGVTWEWNDDVNEVTKAAPKTGLIAQEVQSVLPEVVKEKEDGYLGLDYAKMMGLMVEAIKEQQLQIEALRIEVADLKKQKGL